MKVDVVLLTKNSLSRNYNGVFENCLKSIRREIPVNHLIAVDKHSDDGTIQLIKQYYPSALIIESNALRGKAREIGIRHVETPYFMFIDDDVVLSPNWFEKAVEYFKDDRVAGVWGVDIPGNKHILHRVRIMRFIRGLDTPQLMIRNFLLRGGTHDILIKTDVIKDISIPYDLHVYEDAYIKNYIESKGYKVLPVLTPYCIHYRHTSNDDWNLEKAVYTILPEVKYGFMHSHTLFYLLRNFFLGIPKILLIQAVTRDGTAAKQQFQMYRYMLLAYFKVRFGLGVKRQ